MPVFARRPATQSLARDVERMEASHDANRASVKKLPHCPFWVVEGHSLFPHPLPECFRRLLDFRDGITMCGFLGLHIPDGWL